jgi:hypothetical protein
MAELTSEMEYIQFNENSIAKDQASVVSAATTNSRIDARQFVSYSPEWQAIVSDGEKQRHGVSSLQSQVLLVPKSDFTPLLPPSNAVEVEHTQSHRFWQTLTVLVAILILVVGFIECIIGVVALFSANIIILPLSILFLGLGVTGLTAGLNTPLRPCCRNERATLRFFRIASTVFVVLEWMIILLFTPIYLTFHTYTHCRYIEVVLSHEVKATLACYADLALQLILNGQAALLMALILVIGIICTRKMEKEISGSGQFAGR